MSQELTFTSEKDKQQLDPVLEEVRQRARDGTKRWTMKITKQNNRFRLVVDIEPKKPTKMPPANAK